MDNSVKAFWKSRGMWGPAIMLLAFYSQQAGLGDFDPGAVTDAVIQVILWGGAVVAWVGRALAKYKIGMRDRPADAQ